MSVKYVFYYSAPTLKINESIQELLSSWSNNQDRSSWVEHGSCMATSIKIKNYFCFYIKTNKELTIAQFDEVIDLLKRSNAFHISSSIISPPAS